MNSGDDYNGARVRHKGTSGRYQATGTATIPGGGPSSRPTHCRLAPSSPPRRTTWSGPSTTGCPPSLPRAAFGPCLDPDESRPGALLTLPVTSPAERMAAVPVSTRVNDAKYGGPECVEPAA